ncbi:MAG: hypothetical protein FWC50_12120 [Planctomycetaceae bacterium]|nr:hypothetical protein [Planctomycetaceae bacterium]
MTMTAEYQMMNELIDQVRWNCTVLDAVKQCAQSPEEIREIDKALETSRNVIEKAKEALKSVPTFE